MDLQDFVKSVLVSLDKGVEDARTETRRDIRFKDTVNSRTVEFDVAVSVEESSGAAGKVAIRVLRFAEAGGGVNTENKNTTVSRVQFGVQIDPMTRDEESARNSKNQAALREQSMVNDSTLGY